VTAAAAAGTASLVATATAIGALVYLHTAPTGLSPWRSPVGQYGRSTFRAWYRVLTVAMGVAGTLLCYVLATALHGGGVGVVVALVGVFAACRLAIGWVSTDPPGAPRSTTGALHVGLSVTTFVSAAAAAVRLARPLDDAGHAALCTASRVLGWLMVAGVAVLALAGLSADLRRSLGLSERALYVAVLAWLVVLGGAAATGHLG
jgi:hypothetical protein